MKTFLKIIVGVFIFFYSMFAFIKADLNFINWDEGTRALFVFIYVFTSLALCVFIVEHISNNNHE